MRNSLNDENETQGKNTERKTENVFRYCGPSMLPTFRPGHVLYIRPGNQGVNPGDVIIYKHAGKYVVHRVVSVSQAGYTTRGDNNRLPDAEIVFPEHVVGQVEMVEHQNGMSTVLGGWRGLWQARLGWGARKIKLRLYILVSRPYQWLKTSRLVARIWKPDIYSLQLQINNNSIIKYIYRNKVVAVWDNNHNYFFCHKPYDLVISSPIKNLENSS